MLAGELKQDLLNLGFKNLAENEYYLFASSPETKSRLFKRRDLLIKYKSNLIEIFWKDFKYQKSITLEEHPEELISVDIGNYAEALTIIERLIAEARKPV